MILTVVLEDWSWEGNDTQKMERSSTSDIISFMSGVKIMPFKNNITVYTKKRSHYMDEKNMCKQTSR